MPGEASFKISPWSLDPDRGSENSLVAYAMSSPPLESIKRQAHLFSLNVYFWEPLGEWCNNTPLGLPICFRLRVIASLHMSWYKYCCYTHVVSSKFDYTHMHCILALTPRFLIHEDRGGGWARAPRYNKTNHIRGDREWGLSSFILCKLGDLSLLNIHGSLQIYNY